MNAPRCLALPSLLSALILVLTGCPNEDDALTSTSATESGATEADSDGDPNTSTPSTSTTDDPDGQEPTSSSTTAPDDTTTTTGDPDDTTTTGTTEDASTSGATDSDTTTTGDTTGGASECGNGILEDGEECDKGEENDDGRPLRWKAVKPAQYRRDKEGTRRQGLDEYDSSRSHRE